jgi:hypothetical protein
VTFERFCREVLGCESGYIQKIREGVAILEGIGIANPTVGQALDVAERAEQFDGSEVPEQVYGKGKPGPGRGNKTDNDVIRFRQGNDPDYLTARIARDRPDIHQRMKDGKYKSVRAAAIEAGIIKVPTGLQQLQKAWRKASDDERQSFLEWLEVPGRIHLPAILTSTHCSNPKSTSHSQMPSDEQSSKRLLLNLIHCRHTVNSEMGGVEVP